MKLYESKSALGSHIRQLRDTRKLTLAGLAALTGISAATLSRVENGEVSPTAEVLGSLSTALEIPISQLLIPLERKFRPLIHRHEQTIWADPENDFVRRNVSPPSGQLAVELIEVELGAKQCLSYEAASIPGQEHHLYLFTGELDVTVEGTTHSLRAGDCLRYKLYGPTTFQTQTSKVRYVLALI